MRENLKKSLSNPILSLCNILSTGKTYFDLNSYMEFDTKLRLSFDLNLNTEHLHFDLEKRHRMDIDTEKN